MPLAPATPRRDKPPSSAAARQPTSSCRNSSDADIESQREHSSTSDLGSDALRLMQVKAESATEDDEDDAGDIQTFQPRPSLPAPRVEHRSLQELMDQLDKEDVDLNPEYQRDVVWDKTRMMGLIDSVVENHYIPPIIFNRKIARNQDGTARVRRICIDGKQRLSSVKAFLSGAIGCHDRNGSVWYFSPSANRKGRRIVPEHVKEAFQNRQFIIYEYPNLRRAQEEELFARVQKGVQLTSAEKFRATTGPWQDFAKRYDRDFPGVTGLSGTKRGASFNNILTSFGQILEVRCSRAKGRPACFSTSNSTIRSLLSNRDEYNGETRNVLRHTYTRFDELIEAGREVFQDNGYTHAKLFSPFEFMATTVLISVHMEDQSNLFLLEGIRVMRLYLRQCLKDLRMNRSSWNVAWPFIENLLPQNEQGLVATALPSQTKTSADELAAVRAVLAQRLARLSPAIDAAHVPASCTMHLEAPSTLTAPNTPGGIPPVVHHAARDANPGIGEQAELASSSPANAQRQQLGISEQRAQPRHLPTLDGPVPAGINRKRKLARFTASGSSPMIPRRAQSPEADDMSATRELDVKPTLRELTAREAPSVAHAPNPQRDTDSPNEGLAGAAEQLLGSFEPHRFKRAKIKTEQALGT